MVKIILDGKDLTPNIKDWYISNNSDDFLLTVQYQSDKKYTRPLSEFIIEPVKKLSGDLLYNKKKKIVQEIKEAVEVGEKYLFITYPGSDKKYRMYCQDIEITQGTKMKQEDIYKYFREIAEERVVLAKNEQERKIAGNIVNQFNKLVSYDRSALNAYINQNVKHYPKKEHLIYPFGINETQMEAVSNAFISQISIIEGPPGTGKTQTILNILANILINGQTCAVVSNNNPAVENVYEKLAKVDLDFLIAKLGKTENRENFFTNIKYQKPINNGSPVELFEITNILNRVKSYLTAKNDLARLTAEIKELEIEKEYLDKWHQDYPEIKIIDTSKYKLAPAKTVELQAYLRILADDFISFKKKIDLMFHYHIFKNKFLNDLENRQNFIFSLQYAYYEKVLKEKNQEKIKIEAKLQQVDFNKEIELLRNESMNYLYYYIIKKMPNCKPDFNLNDYRNNFDNFTKCFPIIGSSTHSLLNSIGNGYIFDYVIVDEASQQDIVPGILCFGCTKNVIIVGDRKQLQHIPIKSNLTCRKDFYDCQKYSLLDSVSEIFGDRVPRTLLKEHYRCHPKIIQFCNKQFYDNELIAMTEDHGEKSLSLITTALGNHMRNFGNLREIQSLLKIHTQEQVFFKDSIGFIAPYNKQIELAKNHLSDDFIKDTIHKFQGRECDEIVFSTVLDKKRCYQQQINFVDDASLVNVAVSRAKNKFTLVTGNNVFTSNNKHLAALIRYIEYYANEEMLYDSPVISAFDLLYREYDKSLEKLNARLNKQDSRYKSEQIVATLIRDILSLETFKTLTFHQQIYLKQLVSINHELFTDDENTFIKNNSSCDFVIYYQIGKKPLAVIEVDGGYHSKPEQIIRDKKKNSILAKANIPLLRLPTIESEIRIEIIDHLRKCLYKDDFNR